tara:strand:- start:95 stop:949 length:855 start_codon:yes stop_codon:yes gene_type:complete
MSKMKKIAESFIDNLLRRSVLKLGDISTSELAELLANEVSDELKWGAVKESYLHEYKTKKLTDLLNKKVNEGLDEDSIEVTFNIISILNLRYRQYSLETGDYNIRVAPEEVDKALFPKQKIPPVERSKVFTIDDWKELHIEIRAMRPNSIFFHKILNGKPSFEKAINKTPDELHLGDATIQILQFFGSVYEGQSIPYENKNAVFRINKALRELFGMDEVPIKTKDGEISAAFNVSYFDMNDAIVTRHNIHHDSTDVYMESIASQEDGIGETNADPSMDDEENYI